MKDDCRREVIVIIIIVVVDVDVDIVMRSSY